MMKDTKTTNETKVKKEGKNMRYPIIATRGIIAFPGQETFLEIGREASLQAIDITSLQFDSHVILVSQKDPMTDIVKSERDLYTVGTLVRFNVERTLEGGSKTIVVRGIERVRISEIKIAKNGFIDGEFKIVKSKNLDADMEQAYIENISKKLDSAISNVVNIPKNVISTLSNGVSSGELADIIANYMPIPFDKKQKVLETSNIQKRLELVNSLLFEETEAQEIDRDIDKNVRGALDKQQREFLLREKMKAIKEELGEMSSKDSDIDMWREKLMDKKYPEYVKDKINDEIRKFEAMPPISAEAHVSRGYIEWLIKLPWDTYTDDNSSLEGAKKALDKGHYGLKKVKERIIEYLAVKIATKKKTSPIITFVGPPGVGKTSLSKSIGEAVGREVIKVSLGGVKDESEIRGHRRTYVGAMPGKIIQALNKAKTSNPIILLDEIDKMASDFRGDPTSAMLEVLDPEQNSKFQDHYVELEYDLSRVMFIATANYYEQIPEALLDRVEIIFLDQYTSEEKLKIVKGYIIPKSIKDHGLKKTSFKINDKTLLFLIHKYTQEAGVRGLQRVIDQLSRKIVVGQLEGKITGPFTITEENIVEMLGKEKISKEKLKGKAEVGYATGMYYSSVGGGTLPIEVNTFASEKGGIKLTGSIKDVMKESMEVAIGYLKSNATKYGINFDFENTQIQVHVPEGATPKDGPSAGIAFTTAILSALINKPVSKEIAMTGEITLRGNVLQIGGLKQKTLGAVEAGVKTIFIPKTNIKDIDELADKVKKEAKIIPVENYTEIFDHIFA